MRQVKQFICDGYGVPTDEEILECINIAKNENCYIELHYTPYLGPSRIMGITSETTFEECKEVLNDYIMR